MLYQLQAYFSPCCVAISHLHIYDSVSTKGGINVELRACHYCSHATRDPPLRPGLIVAMSVSVGEECLLHEVLMLRNKKVNSMMQAEILLRLSTEVIVLCWKECPAQRCHIPRHQQVPGC